MADSRGAAPKPAAHQSSSVETFSQHFLSVTRRAVEASIGVLHRNTHVGWCDRNQRKL